MILTTGSAGLVPLLQVTQTIPIVFTIVPDPVGAGFIDSLAHPGGNATGFSQFEFGLSAKWLELLKEIAPGATRAAVLREPGLTAAIAQFAALQAVAPSLRVDLVPLNFRDADQMERSVAEFALLERWTDRHLRTVGHGSPRGDCCDGGPTQAARGLCLALHGDRRRPDLLWAGFRRPVSACRRLCRSHPQRRKADRPAGAGADQIRAGNQPQDRESTRPYRAIIVARARR